VKQRIAATLMLGVVAAWSPPRSARRSHGARLSAIVMTFAMICGAAARANAADTPGPGAAAVDSKTACATTFAATKIEDDPNTVVARALDLAGPFSGTITAYGVDRMWTATIERAAVVAKRYGGREASIDVRADAPIEGLVYAPAWASCLFYAGVRPRTGYEAPDVARPLLTIGNPLPVQRASCDHPYVEARVTEAVEPTGPGGLRGLVSVAVALDERGVPQFTRIVSSAAAMLNASAADAARRSRYANAVFRCKPVPSGYEFNVEYPE